MEGKKNMKIGPRKQMDKGGILTMPLRQNVPWPTDKTWKLTACPSCGRECWDRPLQDLLHEVEFAPNKEEEYLASERTYKPRMGQEAEGRES